MKKIITLGLILGLALGYTTTAQVDNARSKNGQSAAPSEVKSRYINNQDYLSKSSPRGYQSYYGDSLNGFDEAGLLQIFGPACSMARNLSMV